MFVNQYNTSPAGKNAKNTVKITGKTFMTRAWMGSAGAGFRRCCISIAAPISSGRMKYGSRLDRSWIHSMNGAWRISTDSSRTQ